MVEDQSAVRARIDGWVQGVWYRGWTVDTARALGLVGWVRNRYDGSVEALFVGPAAAVHEMLARCLDGPPAARVRSVTPTPVAPPDPAPTDFDERPTA